MDDVESLSVTVESESVEFVPDISHLDEASKSLAAMLNKGHEGTVYFGVDDNGKIIGLEVDSGTIEGIRGFFSGIIAPSPELDIDLRVNKSGNRYIVLSAKGNVVPYSCDGRYYIRRGNENVLAGADAIARLALSRGLDPLKDTPSAFQELTFNYLLGMLISYRIYPHQGGLFDSYNMLDMDGRFNLLGYLLSDQNVLPMQIIEFRGKDKGFIYKKLDYGGQSIIGSFTRILDAMNGYMCNGTDEEGNNVALFDFAAFQEAWVNACLHNAWWNMIPPSVFVFDDRIEVTSFGNIPYALSLEDFYTGDSFPVNQSLFEVFTELHFIGDGGHGVPLIVNSCGREAFRFTGSSVIVTIPFRFKPPFVEYREARDRSRSDLDHLKQGILNYLERNPRAKLSEVSEASGISLSSVKKIVTSLKADGLLDNTGTNRNSQWVIR